MKAPRIMRDVGLQAAGNYVQTGANALRGLVLARILGPADFGLISAINVAINYLLYLDMGASLGVMREIPLEVGREHEREADAWEGTGLIVRLASGFAGALILGLVTALRWESLSEVYRACLLLGCAVLCFQAVLQFAQVVLQARRRYRTLATLMIAVATCTMVAGISGALLAGAVGALAGQAIVFGIGFVVVLRTLVRPRPRLVTRRRLWQLVKIGAPLLVLQALGTNLVSIDQVLAGTLLGVDQLGLYTLAMFAGLVLQLIALSVSGAVGPRQLNIYGQRNEIEDVRRLTWRPVWLLSLVLPPAVTVLWLAAPLVIDWFLPAYSSVIAPLRINVVGVFFLAINFGVGSILVTVNRHAVNIPIIASCLALNVAIDLVLIRVYDLGLSGIAIGSLCSYAVYWFVHTLYVRHLFEARLWRAVRLNLAAVWPGLLLVALLVAAWQADLLAESHVLVEVAAVLGVSAVSAVRWFLGHGHGEARGETVAGGS